jgi:hypothetical protein
VEGPQFCRTRVRSTVLRGWGYTGRDWRSTISYVTPSPWGARVWTVRRMPMTPPPKPPPGSIDFELTDFGDARRALDELPAGVSQLSRLMHGDEWAARRRKPLPTDRALTGEAMDWVIGLPAALRPHCACEAFPRVINAIAASWPDLPYSLQVIGHMMHDYRGGRRGFPTAVRAELQALYDHQRQRAGG